MKISDQQYFLCMWYYIFPKIIPVIMFSTSEPESYSLIFSETNRLTAYAAELSASVYISTFISWLHAIIIDMYYKKFTLEDHAEWRGNWTLIQH